MPDTVDKEAPAEVVAILDGIEVPNSPILRPKMIERMKQGGYETAERRLGLAAVPEGARILEMGAGAGIVGAIIAKNRKAVKAISIEANPTLLPHIRALYAQNGLTDVIEPRHCVVMAGKDAPPSIQFGVSGHFLGSGLHLATERTHRTVEVPVVRYDALKAEFPHDVILMDIEGAELEFLTNADLSGVNVVVVEMHRSVLGREGMVACRKAMQKAGFEQPAELSESGVVVWRRRGAA